MESPAEGAFRDFLRSRSSQSHYVVAFSGGVDSMVLLHLAARFIKPAHLSAVHVDHGLQAQSCEWSEHCRRICSRLGVRFRSRAVRIETRSGESTEALAREARYAALTQAMSPEAVLLTAHHQADQSETLLLQLFRGAGVTGCAGIARERVLAEGRLARPLLNVPKQTILDYADEHGLDWIEDPSNGDTSLRRNWIRHSLLPQLRGQWPGLDACLGRAARHQAEASQLLDELAALDASGAVADDGCLDLSSLSGLGRARTRNLLRFWIRAQAIPLPGEVFIDRILDECVNAQDDAQPLIEWAGACVRRFDGRLHLLAGSPTPGSDWSTRWDWCHPLILPHGLGQLKMQPAERGISRALLQSGHLSVSFRSGGERFRLVPGGPRRELKKLMQEWRVPPWERGCVPLIHRDDELLAVPGHWAGPTQSADAVTPVWIR